MVEHLVWFKLKDDVTDEQKQAMVAGLRALRGQIEGIEHLACGEDFSGRSKGYQIGLIVRLTSRAALEAYGPHPLHQAFIQRFKPLWEDVMALDFEEA
jgi:Stress responsive A/B Barrel Domain